MSVLVVNRECVAEMNDMAESSVSTIITDPPYHLTQASRGGSKRTNDPATPFGRHRLADKGFMGKSWDGGDVAFCPETWAAALRVAKPGAYLMAFGGTRTFHRLFCAIEDAGWILMDSVCCWLHAQGFPKSMNIGKQLMDTELANQWNGHGTSLAPAWEPICLAMKPLDGTYADNAARHGVAGLNIDGGRIPAGAGGEPIPQGRWPKNALFDEEAARLLDQQYGWSQTKRIEKPSDCGGNTWGGTIQVKRGARGHSDSGGASRFFFCSKAAPSERGEYNDHATVKPLDLMRWLCRLTKPPAGGVVLDPFCGSGSTLIAAALEGRESIGIDADGHACEIVERRCKDRGITCYAADVEF